MKKLFPKFYLLIILIFTSNLVNGQATGVGLFTSSESKVKVYYAAIEALSSINFSIKDMDKENGIIIADKHITEKGDKTINLFATIEEVEGKTTIKATFSKQLGVTDKLSTIANNYGLAIKKTIIDLEINIEANDEAKSDLVENNNNIASKAKNIGKNLGDKIKKSVSKETDNQLKVDVISIQKGNAEIPDPEFSARVYYLNGSELNNLERVNASVDVKVKALGYGGGEAFLTAFNSKSNIRFSSDNMPRFIIRIEGNIDPEDILSIVSKSPDKKKDRRRFKIASQTMTGKSRDVSDSEVAYSVRRVRDNIYEVFFEDGLVAGEYAILPVSDKETSLSSSTKVKITCFGID